MPFRRVDLPASIAGKLWLHSMPGRQESWSEFEAQAKRVNLGEVVCLTPVEEIAELSPHYHLAVRRSGTTFNWAHLPMRNFGLPEDPEAYRRKVQEIAQSVREGKAVMLHCAAGIGRTGSTAACVLKALGLTTDEALRRVRDAGSNPQNAVQSGLVDWF
jgi:protein-tyrosine phosphatase